MTENLAVFSFKLREIRNDKEWFCYTHFFFFKQLSAQLAGAVEYTDRISAEG